MSPFVVLNLEERGLMHWSSTNIIQHILAFGGEERGGPCTLSRLIEPMRKHCRWALNL